MAASRDVTVAQDGGQDNVKLHPYLVALVRWCVSCVWGRATLLVHRLMLTRFPPIAASRQSKPRPAGKEHLHPEPRVECEVLHQPQVHHLDVIFVHGLYGSLGNTWRQGEWRSKYQVGPEKVHLRRPASIPSVCNCRQCDRQIHKETNKKNNVDNFSDNMNNCNDIENNYNDNENKYNDERRNVFNDYETLNVKDEFRNIDEKFYKKVNNVLPTERLFITESFYNNILMDSVEIVDNYETQAKFVSDLFKNSNCDSKCDSEIVNNNDEFENDEKNIMFPYENVSNNENICKCSNDGENEIESNEVNCKCKANEDKQCEAGCGCVCDDCYSPCWPKDWIHVDYPDARVISINYTSDPHLWRPLWIKGNKRLRLHERAEQMTQQLLDLGVGQRPVVWVGHSKGGLFIKQIYCEAYEAYLKNNKGTPALPNRSAEDQNMNEFNKDNEINQLNDDIKIANINNDKTNINNDNDRAVRIHEINNNENRRNEKVDSVNDNFNRKFENKFLEVNGEFEAFFEMEDKRREGGDDKNLMSSIKEEDVYGMKSRASLWANSVGFMFYSVPHRGSPLADFKTPLTARSVELLEISKDCSLVLSLQERWLVASAPRLPLVRSLVETRRTLMSVLWLRIVSADSADPGIGALCGVSVDHREICKPSSRHCVLYTELAALIRAAMNRCRCQGNI